MSVIRTRSPYIIWQQAAGLSSAQLQIYVWNGAETDVPSKPVYVLNKNSINDTLSFDISELLSDFIDINFGGFYLNRVNTWCKTSLTGFNSIGEEIINNDTIDLVVDGYNYFENPYEVYPDVLISNREIFVLDGEKFVLPFYLGLSDLDISLINKSGVLEKVTLSKSLGVDIRYLQIGDYSNTFKNRVDLDGGIYEDSTCINVFDYFLNDIDKIIIEGQFSNTTIKVKTISECKFEPKKITFVNKFGVLQDMFFFKKSVEKIAVKKESYRANTFNIASGNFQRTKHTKRDFNITAIESVTLNSGYLSEEYNEVFKQLLLSEKVWLTNYVDGAEQVLPVNVNSKGITYKTSVNDRLVDYAIEFENSFNAINNVR